MANGQERKEELFARKLLLHHFPRVFSQDLECRDMPDLQDVQKSIGVEVVRSLHPNQGELFGLLRKWMNRPINEVPDSVLKRIRKLGYRPLIVGDTFVSASSGFYRITSGNLIPEVTKKINKLQGANYRLFRKNRLFVIVLDPVSGYTRQQMHEFVEKVRLYQEGCVNRFDAIYIYDSDNGEYDLWVCYMKSGVVRLYRGKRESLH